MASCSTSTSRPTPLAATLQRFTGALGWVRSSKAAPEVPAYVEQLGIKTPGVEQRVRYLSGGNQQKVVVAKWLARDCDILIFDEPTRGIDVGAKGEIYKLLNDLTARQGKSVIMISSELPEILRMSHRIIVMCEGRITGELVAHEATEEANHAPCHTCDQLPGRWSEMMESKAVPSKRSAIRADAPAASPWPLPASSCMFVVFSLASPNFATFTNIVGILLSTAVIGILAVGVTFVIIYGRDRPFRRDGDDLRLGHHGRDDQLLGASGSRRRPGRARRGRPLRLRQRHGHGQAARAALHRHPRHDDDVPRAFPRHLGDEADLFPRHPVFPPDRHGLARGHPQRRLDLFRLGDSSAASSSPRRCSAATPSPWEATRRPPASRGSPSTGGRSPSTPCAGCTAASRAS